MTDYNGLVYGLDEQIYHRQPGLSSTGAKKILKSPAHLKHYLSEPEAPKDAFDVGSAVHSKVLGVGAQVTVYPDGNGPERFEYDGAEMDNVLSKTGTTGTNAARAFEAEARSNGLIPVKRVQARVVNLMAESILANQTARDLFESGQPEVSMFVDDTTTGIPLRGRLDYLKLREVVDLKTTGTDASEDTFSRDVFKLGYHVQFGLYEHIYETITGGPMPQWFWVVVESSAPYLTNIHIAGREERIMGQRDARKAIDRYAKALETGIWSGYENSTGGPIGMVRAPMYEVYKHEELT